MLSNNQMLENGLAALEIALDTSVLCGLDNISRLSLDSRTVDLHTAFVGVNSINFKADHFVKKAAENGAIFAFVETDLENQHGELAIESSLIIINVYKLSNRLYKLALAFYFENENQIPNITAITGTNGKTSIATITARLASLYSSNSISIGTLGITQYDNGDQKRLKSTFNTTPDILTIMHQLKQANINSIKIVTIEASSHGLEQNRLGDLPVTCGVFTNLTQDHLDYHRDMQSYAAAKRRLLKQPKINNILLNENDEESLNWAKNAPKSTIIRWYSSSPLGGDKKGYWASEIEYKTQGLSFKLNCNCEDETGKTSSWQVNAPLLGEFNILNLLASIATLHVQGYDLAQLANKVHKLKSVDGRMEVYPSAKATMLVDYAHTPDALEQALKASRMHTKRNLICVFGCGGNRDKTKRVLMGKIADSYSDYIVLTNDNPRTEEPLSIIDDIQKGITRLSNLGRVEIEPNRELAIKKALENTTSEDLILIAGKGHETYIEINNERIFYDERALVHKLSKLNTANSINSSDQNTLTSNNSERECS